MANTDIIDNTCEDLEALDIITIRNPLLTVSDRSGHTDYRIKTDNLFVGGRTVIKKIHLGYQKIYGLVIPLGINMSKRPSEILEVMADAVEDGYGFVPLETMKKIRRGVEESPIRLAQPRLDGFDCAIPLRTAEHRRNYYHWNTSRLDWEIKHINFNTLIVNTEAFMLIVDMKNYQAKPKS